MDMELDTVHWTGNQCRIAGTFTFFVKNFIGTGKWSILSFGLNCQHMAQLCLRNWTISYSAWHKSTDIHIPLGDPKSIVMLKHNMKYDWLILWKTPTLFSRHYITIFLLFFYLVATNSICLAVDSLCILYTQPSYPTPHIIICYIISWSRVNFRLTYFWSIGSWCDGGDGACIGQFCAPEGETFLFHLEIPFQIFHSFSVPKMWRRLKAYPWNIGRHCGPVFPRSIFTSNWKWPHFDKWWCLSQFHAHYRCFD